jgi:hypothetical protein
MPTTVIAGAGQLCAAGGPGLLFGGRDQGLAYASAAVALVDDQCDQTPELSGHLEQREVANAAYLDFAFPYYWHYDALGYFRRQGTEPDSRMAEAVEVVRSKRQPDGRWLLDRIHPGRVHFALEGGEGQPSRWNTLRALRVLDWWEGRAV